ncbi:MAG: SH3 domain-containing protein, partial [Vicinamibacterales bacterium]
MSQSRTLLAVVVAATMTLALAIPVAADLNLVPGQAAHVAYTNGDGINVRNGAGFNAGIITTLHDGVAVTVVEGPMWLDDGTAWYLIAVDTFEGYVEGWVIADYLSGEYVEPANRATSDVQTASGTATVVGTDGYGLRLRDGASLDAGIMAVMPDGATVDVHSTDIWDAEGTNWANLSWDGMTGYAATAFLSIGAGAAPVQPVDEPVAEEPVEGDGFAVGDRAAVVGTGGGGLNLRSEGSYNSTVITILADATIVTILDGPYWDAAGNGWYQVDYSSMTGWVHGGYLAWSDQPPSTDPTLGSVEQPAPEEPVAEEPVDEPVVEEPV